jgi:hypothetical protein
MHRYMEIEKALRIGQATERLVSWGHAESDIK